MLKRSIIALALFLTVLPAQATEDKFTDDDGSPHEASINAIAAVEITEGCRPSQPDLYCPDDPLKRGELAALLSRAYGLRPVSFDYFMDDDGHLFEDAINRLADARITVGCNPPFNTDFCPDGPVTRGQMAAMLARAQVFPFTQIDRFIDDDGHLFESAINTIASADVTKGCDPPTNTRFCPDRHVTRAEFATFITRALGLTAVVDQAPPGDSPAKDKGDESNTGDSSPDTNSSKPSHSDPSTPPAPPPPVDAGDGTVLSGNIQGAFTGTVILEGRVNLIGHVTIANDGLLVARPGVRVEGNGYALDFTNGARADIQGTPVFAWSGNGTNANLDRDITFNNMRRIMFHQGAGKSTLRYFSVNNSGSPELGDYPLHWHLNGDSTRGTLVEGVVVLNGAHHAFVPHGSHGITFRDTIAKNITREAYWWDPQLSATTPGSINHSHDILYDHALADGVHFPRDIPAKGHHRNTAFWLGSGHGNTVRNSAAINVTGGKDCSGFHWPEKDHDVWTFEDNFADSDDCHGIFVWQNDSLNHQIRGFAGDAIEHGAYSNVYQYFDLDIPLLTLHAQSRSQRPLLFEGGRIGTVRTVRHNADADHPVTFRDIQIGTFIVDNGSNGRHPGWYRLENTGLDCDDIVYEDVHAGTRVVVDGREC